MLQALHPVLLALILCALSLAFGWSVYQLAKSSLAVPRSLPATNSQGPRWLNDATLDLLLWPPTTPTHSEAQHRHSGTAQPTQPPPICYVNGISGYICLGAVYNDSAADWHNVKLQTSLFDALGDPIAIQLASLEKRVIRAGERAPYRALFAEATHELATTTTILHSYESRPTSPRPIAVLQDTATITPEGIYQINAHLLNVSSELLHDMRVFATLMDDEDNVIAYRIQQLTGMIAPQERVAVQIELLPMVRDTNPKHHLTFDFHTETNR